MRYKDITLDHIKEYFDNNDYDYGLVHADYDEENPEVLNIFRFDGEEDEENTYVCGVHKDRYDDIIVETETTTSSLNWGEGYIEDEDDDVSIKTIISMIMLYAKSGIYENIDFQKRQIEFINDFGKQCGLEIDSITTTTGNKYE